MNATRGAIRLGFLLVTSLCAVNAHAQYVTAYRVVYKTVYDEQRVTNYRLQYDTVLEDRQVTSMKPEWVTETRQRTVRVAKPVTETSTRNEVHRVMRPVTETETRYHQQVVRRPVTETVMQSQNYLTYEPQTTMRTEYVDQGGFVDQCVYNPGTTRNRLQWLPGAYFVDPRTNTQVYHRGGLHWVPTETPGTYSVQRQYVPNVVARQVPQTTYVQKTVTQQTPVQVTRYVDEVVQQPYEVQVQKWVTEEVNRPVTYTTQRIEYEDQVQNYQVQSMRWVTETNSVQVPRTVAKWIPYETTRLVPRTVVERIPVDACGQPITMLSYPPAEVAQPSIMVAPGTASQRPAGEPTPAAPPAGNAQDAEPTGQPALEKGDLQDLYKKEADAKSEAADKQEEAKPEEGKKETELNSAAGETKAT